MMVPIHALQWYRFADTVIICPQNSDKKQKIKVFGRSVGGLSLTLEKSDVYERTGHPCRLDFERFGELIGLKKKRIEMILDSFSVLPDEVEL